MFTEELNTYILNLQTKNAFPFVVEIAQNFFKVCFKTVSHKRMLSVMCMYRETSIQGANKDFK